MNKINLSDMFITLSLAAKLASIVSAISMFLPQATYWNFVMFLSFAFLFTWSELMGSAILKAVMEIQFSLRKGNVEQEFKKVFSDNVDLIASTESWLKIYSIMLIIACVRIYVPREMDIALDACISIIFFSQWVSSIVSFVNNKSILYKVPIIGRVNSRLYKLAYEQYHDDEIEISIEVNQS